MAIYEYYCPKCKVGFEVFKPMSKSDEPAACTTCGQAAQKLVSVFGSTAGYGIKIPEKSAFRKPPKSTRARK